MTCCGVDVEQVRNWVLCKGAGADVQRGLVWRLQNSCSSGTCIFNSELQDTAVGCAMVAC
ncbi:hypothetical protein Pyn_10529 [Prunus yedoensis var. nudiflora]|uniref:Uncharacterized protein n=1 Tax=Prunus yedoensis var. nudiflora TaxID=2094558 RepID=A0A314UDK4_PRUYE|nr:hypothetical protein Pyn_10529 [Prunus yedoensis var. nudiflora]